MKVLLSGPFNTQTGYGTDLVELAQALLRWGVDLYIHPSGVHPPLPADVLAVLTKPIPKHVDLLISHRCPQELAFSPESAGLYASATVAVAWTMWEWRSLANVDEVNQANCEHAFRVSDNLKRALTSFDVVFAYDEVSQEALSPYHSRVDILQGGVEPLPLMRRDWTSSPFRFLMVGALSSRKNPFAAIKAFKKLRDAGELADAQLVLKSSLQTLHPAMEQWCPGLRVICETWSVAQIHELYRQSHVLLAPSWGEGKNRPAIEFASSGGAVAATRVGGHAQWMRDEYSWPIEYRWLETSPGAAAAIADEDHLAELMLQLYTDRAETARRAEIAARVLPAMVRWHAVLERFCARVASVAGSRGVEVAALMRACRRPDVAEDVVVREARARGALDGVFA